jgi:hypothetical protein
MLLARGRNRDLRGVLRGEEGPVRGGVREACAFHSAAVPAWRLMATSGTAGSNAEAGRLDHRSGERGRRRSRFLRVRRGWRKVSHPWDGQDCARPVTDEVASGDAIRALGMRRRGRRRRPEDTASPGSSSRPLWRAVPEKQSGGSDTLISPRATVENRGRAPCLLDSH